MIDVCKCGHHRDTHHERKGRCLGLGCDDANGNALCPRYRDPSEPDELRQRPTDHPLSCLCFVCAQHAAGAS